MPISKELIQQLREMAMIDKGGWCSMAAVEFTQKHMKALLDEIERLTHLHDLDHSLIDQKQAEIERLKDSIKQIREDSYQAGFTSAKLLYDKSL